MKTKSKILISGLLMTATLAFAGFAYAQTTTPAATPPATPGGIGITQADMQAMVAKEQGLASVILGIVGKGGSPSDPTIIATRKDAMQLCATIGQKAYSITKQGGSGQFTNITTMWAESNDQCTFTYWEADTGGTDIMARPPYSVRTTRVSLNPADPRVSGLRDTILAGTTFDKSVKDAADQAQLSQPSSDWWTPVSELIDWVLTSLFNVITTVLLGLVSLAGAILNYSISQTTTAIQPQFVQAGWVIVRDLFNMFFILAIIVMAISTILRRPAGYEARSLILRLIIMALLVNFSKVIADTLVGASNIIVNLFHGDYISYGVYFKALVLGGNTSSLAFFNTTSGGAPAALVAGILKVFSALLITASFGAIAILLLIRLIGLWVLTMLSPVAYALNILPRTAVYAKQWWQYFLKYLIWAPVSMFFLYIGQTLVNTKASLTGNGMFDALYIAIFFFAALFVVKQAGMIGSGAILSAADNFWKGGGSMLSKYVVRGSFAKHIGQGIDAGVTKVRNQRDDKGKLVPFKGAQKFGTGWQRTAQYAEAVPGAVSEGFKTVDKRYKKGVTSAQNEMLYRTGFLEDKEMTSNYADAKRLFTDKIKKGLTPDDLELIQGMNRKGLSGAFEAFQTSINDPNAAKMDETLRDEAEEAFLKKLGVKEMPDGHSIFNKLSKEEIDKLKEQKKGFSGFWYKDEKDPSKGIVVEADTIKENNQPGKHRTARLNANPKATELDLLDLEQKTKVEAVYNKYKQDITKTTDRYTALKSDPEGAGKILEAETKGEILTTAQLRTAREFVDAYEGDGARTEVSNSIVTDTGKVIINRQVAEAWGMEPDDDAFVTKEEFGEFARVLKEKGGVSDTDLKKLQVTVDNVGSIAIQQGTMKSLSPIVKEALGPDALGPSRMLRKAQGQEKTHEGLHRFMEFVKKSNEDTYKQVVNRIINYDKKNFDEIRKDIKSVPAYANLDDNQVVQEIIAQPQYRNRLDPKLVSEISVQTDNDRKNYLSVIRKSAEKVRLGARSGELAKVIVDRDPELLASVDHVRKDLS